MKNSKLTLLVLVFSFICNVIALGQPAAKQIYYQVSSNSLYYPGDKVNINLYAYSYSEKEKSKEKYSFLFTVYKIKKPAEFFLNQSSQYSIDVLGADSTNLLYYCEEINSFHKTISPKNEYGYFYVNESYPVSVYESGAYLVKVSYDAYVAYTGFVITSYGVVSKTGINNALAYVVERKTGEPVSDANLDFYFQGKKVSSGTTQNGIYYTSYNINENQQKQGFPMFLGEKNGEIIISDAYYYYGNYSNKYNSYIFTNQPVYRTGSDVFFKGTIKKRELEGYESVSNKKLSVKINDSKGAEVFSDVMYTNENGSFDGTYKINEDSPLGTYYIYAVTDDNVSFSASFEVEQFKKPEYKVEVTTDKSQYYGKDVISASVQADYFFGSPVTDADVEYNIYKVPYYTPWWKFSDYAWWYEDYYENYYSSYNMNQAVMIYTGKGKLNNEGKFQFTYNVKEDFKSQKNKDYYYYWWWGSTESDYKYLVQAKVVDKSRREISGMTSAFVTRGGFYLNVKADKYFYNQDENIFFEVNARNFADSPVKTKFKAKIYQTEWRYYYEKNYENSRILIKEIDGETKIDGKALVEFKPETTLKAGYYQVEVTANDERNNDITTSANFYVSGKDYSWWYNSGSDAVQIITDKDSYKKGEVCKAMIYLTKPGANVLITSQTDNILFYKVEKFNTNMMAIEIPIDNRYNSNFEITVNYVLDNQFYSSSKHVFVVPEDKFLTIEITPSKQIYKPKDDGTMKIKVLDYLGNPVKNAEVSLGIIDESIYYVKQDKTIDIRKAFYGMSTGYIYTQYNYNSYKYGYSRLMTIFEKFNIKSIKESELGTVKGTLFDKNNTPIPNANLIIDDNYYACTTGENGEFEFNLPEGKYTIGLFNGDDGAIELTVLKVNKGGVYDLKLKADIDIKDYDAGFGIVTLQSGRIVSQPTSIDTEEKSVDNVKTEAPKKNGKKEDKGKENAKDEKLVEPDVRSDFRDAILWMPYVKTDENGYAEVNVKYPDNLTEWRLTAKVITNDTKVGQNLCKVKTRKDLLVRMETPRFLQEQDDVTITTIIHNYLSTSKEVTVRFKSEGVKYSGESEKKITINSGEDKSIDWVINVTEPYGTAKFYCEALTDEESDAVELKVPLQPKGMEVITNLITDIPDLNKTENKIFNIPAGTDLRSAYYKLSVSPSIASTLMKSLDELIGYPYGCVEQTMSRFLPSVIVMNAFKEINAPISDKNKQELPKMVDAGVKRLLSFQHSDGGWGWWTNDQSNAYMTAYVIYGLSIADASGYKVKSGVISKGLKHLKDELKKDIDLTSRAYMLYAMSVAGGKEYGKFAEEEAIKLSKESKLNDFGHSLLAMTFYNVKNQSAASEEIKALNSNVKYYGDNAAYWEGSSFHYNWQDDKVQTTAMALKAYVNIDPDNPLIGKIVRWLLMQRNGFSWRNTQETALTVYSMVDYLKISKEFEANFEAKVFVNNELIYQKTYTKDDVFKNDSLIKIPGNKLKSGDNDVRIEKNGSGKLYYSSSIVYFDKKVPVSAQENGFRVEKEYFKLEKYEYYNEQKIEYRKKYFDGTVNSGDLILVKVRVYSKEKELSYFMMQDPIPAGCEVMKDDWQFKIQDEKDYTGYSYYYWRWWYADKDVWDNRITFFATYLYGGEQEFSYVLRAQIPGEYSINPTKAMLMYYNEINGNTTDSKLIIK